jgi:hypothetical protein
MTESIGISQPTLIPSLSDAANIQAALRLYHYGTATEGAVAEQSVAGYIADIYDQISGLGSTDPINLGINENLNTKQTTGIYSQISTSDARTSSSFNYPLSGGLAYAGILTVVVAENVVFQTYQMESVDSTGAQFWRSKNTAGTWSSWKQTSDTAHVHDDRYYTETELQTSGSSSVHPNNLNASVPITKGGTGALDATNARLNLEIFNSQTAVTAGTDRTPFGGKIFIANPTVVGTTGANIEGAATGDLWFW